MKIVKSFERYSVFYNLKLLISFGVSRRIVIWDASFENTWFPRVTNEKWRYNKDYSCDGCVDTTDACQEFYHPKLLKICNKCYVRLMKYQRIKISKWFAEIKILDFKESVKPSFSRQIFKNWMICFNKLPLQLDVPCETIVALRVHIQIRRHYFFNCCSNTLNLLVYLRTWIMITPRRLQHVINGLLLCFICKLLFYLYLVFFWIYSVFV